MAHILHLVICLSLICMSTSELVIDVQPSIILPEITPQLVINCSITNNQVQHLQVIKSLTLSRFNETIRDFEDLVALDSSTLDLKKLMPFKYSQISFGNLYITLTLYNPTEFDAEVYRCMVNGDTSNWTNISLFAKKGVEHETNSTALIEKIRNFKKDEVNSKCTLQNNDLKGSKVHFFANSDIFKRSIEPLTLKCSFQAMKQDENESSTLQSLYILHESNRIIANINKGQEVLTPSQRDNSKNIQGEIHDVGSKDSYLQVTWSNVKSSESGKYFCEANVKHSDGRAERLSEMLIIAVVSPTFDDLVKVVEKLLEQFNEHKSHLQENIEKNREMLDRNKQTMLLIKKDVLANQQSLQNMKEVWNSNQTNIIILKEELQSHRQNISTLKENFETVFSNFSTALIDIKKQIVKERSVSNQVLSCRDVRSIEDRLVVFLASGLKVMCDTKTDGGGWLIFQRRINGKVDFYRGWKEYRDGFGDYNIGEFYLGNDYIFNLTSTGKYDLRVDLKYNDFYYAQYSNFQILSEKEKYQLKIGAYSGNAGDSLSYHNNAHFSTYDQDNDNSSMNCAWTVSGAWWYKSCHHVNLNGRWRSKESGKSVTWRALTGEQESVLYSEMKIREKD
ncbi:BpFREP5.1 [Biomphalaria pfeifferi]|uniref:BpFREP5.1 n=1 Tax=Biomphalaria pfeifferi TaxID=112525 RepID=A0AAD8C3V9_BIOPF|nr:BpFREP5.1 [Biomphalaria pfeifferi]